MSKTTEKQYLNDKKYEKIDFSITKFDVAEYQNCIFKLCNFSNSNLSYSVFINCEFVDCNLSMVKLNQTAMRQIRFRNSKMLGIQFQDTNPFLLALDFEDCVLNLSSFYKVNIKKTRFINCTLQEVDFTSADLTAAIFDNCDMAQATFDATILEKSDFRTAYNYQMYPEKNRIKRARFSTSGLSGLLYQYDIEIDG